MDDLILGRREQCSDKKKQNGPVEESRWPNFVQPSLAQKLGRSPHHHFGLLDLNLTPIRTPTDRKSQQMIDRFNNTTRSLFAESSRTKNARQILVLYFILAKDAVITCNGAEMDVSFFRAEPAGETEQRCSIRCMHHSIRSDPIDPVFLWTLSGFQKYIHTNGSSKKCYYIA